MTDNGKNAFTYNHANRMASSDVASYVYDGHGRRVKNARIMGDDYSFYDAAGRLVYREKADGTKVKYAFLAKLQVARIENGTTTKYVHTDLLGSPVVESDNTGSVLEATRMHYRPFGQTKETPKDEVGYTGHMFDTDIGLVYAQQRYYDSEIGRFYGDDPVDAVSFVNQGNVHGFGRYTYVNNNPYKYVDPDGRAWSWAMTGLGAAAGALASFSSEAIDQTIEVVFNDGEYDGSKLIGKTVKGMVGGAVVGALTGAATGDPSASIVGITLTTAVAGGAVDGSLGKLIDLIDTIEDPWAGERYPISELDMETGERIKPEEAEKNKEPEDK